MQQDGVEPNIFIVWDTQLYKAACNVSIFPKNNKWFQRIKQQLLKGNVAFDLKHQAKVVSALARAQICKTLNVC